MPTVEKDIEIDASVDQIYQMWTNYESFPRFMENVEEVRRTGPNMTHWKARVGGKNLEWDARHTEESRNRVAWQAQGEAGQSGEVRFQEIGPNKTKVNVKLDYKLPSGFQENVAKIFGIDDHVVKEDLKNFKRMAEERGTTGTTGTRTGTGTTSTTGTTGTDTRRGGL